MKDGTDQQDDDSDYEDNLERPGGDDATNDDEEGARIITLQQRPKSALSQTLFPACTTQV